MSNKMEDLKAVRIPWEQFSPGVWKARHLGLTATVHLGELNGNSGWVFFVEGPGGLLAYGVEEARNKAMNAAIDWIAG